MAHALSLHEMVPDVPLEGTVLAYELLCNSEIAQCIKDMMMEGDLDFVYPILGHPTMRPDTSFVEFISSSWFSSQSTS
jgi:hypothetical protein